MDSLKIASVLMLAFTLSLSTINCKNKTAIQAECQPGNMGIADAIKQSVGVWKLVSIKSGWTSKITKPDNLLLIDIDSQQRIKVFENGKEVNQIQINFSKPGTGIYYQTTERSSGTNGIYLNEGEFRVCAELLVLDHTAHDGPAYTFEKQK